MTLSRFLRDYLYIPLGGSRSGPVRQVVNVVATMLLGGLWHGAAWTFVVWGGLHGAALAVNHVWGQTGPRLPRPVSWLLTLVFVIGCWVLFRAPDFGTAGSVLTSMAGVRGVGSIVLDRMYVIALVFGGFAAALGPTSHVVALTRLRPHPWLAVPAGIALGYLMILIGGRLPNVFIYFQF
jgi:D-alanyl-lipoteichoic acid acyltransferase DltB (MBOAT superfamily)